MEFIEVVVEAYVMENEAQFPTLWLTFALSQNVLCQSKFLVTNQNFIYVLCQSQTFCARQKDDLHSVKLVFVPAKKFLKGH